MNESKSDENTVKNKKSEIDKKSLRDLLKRIRDLEEELVETTNKLQTYIFNLLKFGAASCIFGFSVFFSFTLIHRGPKFMMNMSLLPLSLLMITPAPIAVFVFGHYRKFRRKINQLKQTRKRLSAKYSRMALKKLKMLC